MTPYHAQIGNRGLFERHALTRRHLHRVKAWSKKRGRESFLDTAGRAACNGILAESVASTRIRIAAYSLMPNHWHLLIWPRRDGELSEVLRWITVTHTQRWHAHHTISGTGPVYQGRFKSFPVQTDAHFLTVARYVERNALRARLVERAEEWQWCSLWSRTQDAARKSVWLNEWPVERPRDWLARVNRAQAATELEALRISKWCGNPDSSLTMHPGWLFLFGFPQPYCHRFG